MKYLWLILLLILFATCKQSNNQSLKIVFSADSSKIVVSGLQEEDLYALKKLVAEPATNKKLLNVLEVPAENDSTGRERVCEGTVQLVDKQLVFNPEKPFQKNRSYWVETIIGSEFADLGDALQGHIGHKLRTKSTMLYR